MAKECSPLLDVVDDVSEVTQPDATRLEASASTSSSKDSSGGGSSEDVDVEPKTEIEKIVVVDPCESARSYDFGLSTIILGHIQQLEMLRYFAEGSAREPGEETVLEHADDEAIVFEELFTIGI
jgi:hypothetical protein